MLQNTARRIDLSNKFILMGSALIQEGKTSKDITIKRVGLMVSLLSSAVLDDDDMTILHELCSMFTAKKKLESEGLMLDPFEVKKVASVINKRTQAAEKSARKVIKKAAPKKTPRKK